MGENVTNLLLGYAVVIFLCQLLPFKDLENRLLRSNAAIVSLAAYLVLFCPSILLVIDVQETVALVYMFYLNIVAWDFGVYWLLCIAWILYPGLMCVLGLLPATFFLSDIKIYGQFHCFLRRSKCPETCPLSKKTDHSDIEENDDESETVIEKSQEKIPLEDKPYEMPKFTKIKKIPLESEKSVMIVNIPSAPQEKKIRDTQNFQIPRKIISGSRVNLKAIICDILGLVHGTLYLFSIQCLYFIVTGLYPMFNFIVVAVAIAAFEIYVNLWRRCEARLLLLIFWIRMTVVFWRQKVWKSVVCLSKHFCAYNLNALFLLGAIATLHNQIQYRRIQKLVFSSAIALRARKHPFELVEDHTKN